MNLSYTGLYWNASKMVSNKTSNGDIEDIGKPVMHWFSLSFCGELFDLWKTFTLKGSNELIESLCTLLLVAARAPVSWKEKEYAIVQAS